MSRPRQPLRLLKSFPEEPRSYSQAASFKVTDSSWYSSPRDILTRSKISVVKCIKGEENTSE